MNISLPEALKSFVDTQVAERATAPAANTCAELIRADQDRSHLRDLLLQGAASAPGPAADPAYFDALRQRVRTGPASGTKA